MSTRVDLTAMVDLAFLLVTFFMLTTKFRPEEPVMVDTPSSVAEIKLPDRDIMMLIIDSEGRIFYDVDGKQTRVNILQKMFSTVFVFRRNFCIWQVKNASSAE